MRGCKIKSHCQLHPAFNAHGNSCSHICEDSELIHIVFKSRGMQSTIYVELAPGVSVEDLYQHLCSFYEKEEFVIVLKKNEIPHTRHIRGSNYPDRIPGRAIIISVIDNLVKGASGQALQNLNLMMGIPENTGIRSVPLFP